MRQLIQGIVIMALVRYPLLYQNATGPYLDLERGKISPEYIRSTPS
jgi:hypothetical protein